MSRARQDKFSGDDIWRQVKLWLLWNQSLVIIAFSTFIKCRLQTWIHPSIGKPQVFYDWSGILIFSDRCWRSWNDRWSAENLIPRRGQVKVCSCSLFSVHSKCNGYMLHNDSRIASSFALHNTAMSDGFSGWKAGTKLFRFSWVLLITLMDTYCLSLVYYCNSWKRVLIYGLLFLDWQTECPFWTLAIPMKVIDNSDDLVCQFW